MTDAIGPQGRWTQDSSTHLGATHQADIGVDDRNYVVVQPDLIISGSESVDLVTRALRPDALADSPSITIRRYSVGAIKITQVDVRDRSLGRMLICVVTIVALGFTGSELIVVAPSDTKTIVVATLAMILVPVGYLGRLVVRRRRQRPGAG